VVLANLLIRLAPQTQRDRDREAARRASVSPPAEDGG
jgi:hypothetical protein